VAGPDRILLPQREDRRKHRCQDEEPHYRPRGERNALEQRHEQGERWNRDANNAPADSTRSQHPLQAKRRRWTAVVTAHATAATALHTAIIATAGLAENPATRDRTV